MDLGKARELLTSIVQYRTVENELMQVFGAANLTGETVSDEDVERLTRQILEGGDRMEQLYQALLSDA